MKLTLWDILAVLALVATAGIIIIYGTLFINPHTSINLFPPPEMPTPLVLPTSTATLRMLPQTWTPTPFGGAPTEVKPSGTPIPSGTPVILPSGTITLVPTHTVTRNPYPHLHLPVYQNGYADPNQNPYQNPALHLYPHFHQGGQ